MRVVKLLKRPLFWVILVVAGGGGLFAFQQSQRPTESPYDFTTVRRGTLEERVLTTATVKAADEFELSFAASGRIAAVHVAVGDNVTRDGELARLDTAALEARVRTQRAAVSNAAAQLNKALVGASATEIAVAERAVDSAQISLNNTNADLADKQRTTSENLSHAYDDLLNVFRDVELSAEGAIQTMNSYYDVSCGYQCLRTWGIFLVSSSYKAQLESGKVSADAALASLQSIVAVSTMQTPQGTLDASANTLKTHVNTIIAFLNTAHAAFQEEADKTTVQTVRLDLNAKLTALNNQTQTIATVRSTNTTTISAAQNAVRNAEAAVASARASLNSLIAPPRTVDVAALRAGVASAQAGLDAANADLTNAVIKAPIDGIITQVNIHPGEIAGAGIAIGMVSGATYAVEANVPEADIAKIAVGNTSAITGDALPGQQFGGNVVSIDPAEQVIGGVVTFKVTTDIHDGISMLRPGMTADLEIFTARVEDALYVPQRAVVREGSEAFLRIIENDELVRIPVTTGIRSTEGMIEITSDVTEGQEIVNFVKE